MLESCPETRDSPGACSSPPKRDVMKGRRGMENSQRAGAGDAARKVYTLWRALTECRDEARAGAAAARYVAGTAITVVGQPSSSGPRLTVLDGSRAMFLDHDSDQVLLHYRGCR